MRWKIIDNKTWGEKATLDFLKKKQSLTEKVVLLKFIFGNFIRFFGCRTITTKSPVSDFWSWLKKQNKKNVLLFREFTIIICYNVFTEKVQYRRFLIMRSYVNFFQSNDANFVVLQMKLIWKRKSEQTCHKKEISDKKRFNQYF